MLLAVQFVVTSRVEIKLSLNDSDAISERIVRMERLGEVDSAKLFVSMAKIRLNHDKLKTRTCDQGYNIPR